MRNTGKWAIEIDTKFILESFATLEDRLREGTSSVQALQAYFPRKLIGGRASDDEVRDTWVVYSDGRANFQRPVVPAIYTNAVDFED